MPIFSLKKMMISPIFEGCWHDKVYFMKLYISLNLRTTFQVSSITVTSFRRAGGN